MSIVSSGERVREQNQGTYPTLVGASLQPADVGEVRELEPHRPDPWGEAGHGEELGHVFALEECAEKARLATLWKEGVRYRRCGVDPSVCSWCLAVGSGGFFF